MILFSFEEIVCSRIKGAHSTAWQIRVLKYQRFGRNWTFSCSAHSRLTSSSREWKTGKLVATLENVGNLTRNVLPECFSMFHRRILIEVDAKLRYPIRSSPLSLCLHYDETRSIQSGEKTNFYGVSKARARGEIFLWDLFALTCVRLLVMIFLYLTTFPRPVFGMFFCHLAHYFSQCSKWIFMWWRARERPAPRDLLLAPVSLSSSRWAEQNKKKVNDRRKFSIFLPFSLIILVLGEREEREKKQQQRNITFIFIKFRMS